MSDTLPETTLDLYRIDAETGDETLAGQAEYYADGRLVLLQAEPEFEAELRTAIDTINSKPRLVEMVPPEASETPFATGAQVTERGAPDFIQALDRYLRRYYGFGVG